MCKITKKDCEETTLKRINAIARTVKKAGNAFNEDEYLILEDLLAEIVSDARSAINWMEDLK